MNNVVSRRVFLGTAAAAAGMVSTGCFARSNRKPDELLNVGVIGIGGKGWSDWHGLLATKRCRIVAMCDTNRDLIERAKEEVKDAKFYTDYRKMFDEVKGLDIVSVSTPDHTHARAAIEAMKRGANVYVQKPLVRTLWESEYFKKTARENGVVTQMGNQGSSTDGMRRGVEILRSGILGKVREVHVWTNRPEIEPGCKWGWHQPLFRPKDSDPVPPNLDWDCWIGTAPFRPYKKSIYEPIEWRAWYDFGTGAFGDMACHTMNLPFRGLELGRVISGEAVEITPPYPETYPLWSKVRITCESAGGKKPNVDIYWYDGYRKPVAEIIPQVINTMGKIPATGCVVLGDNGILCSTNDYGEQSYIALKGEAKMKGQDQHPACKDIPVTLPRVHSKHYDEFVAACFGETKAFSDIDNSIPLVEAMQVGCLAQRVSGKISWDAEKCVTDNEEANKLIKPFIRPGWEF
ncbi:MAG: Gfo/Idh/MocA family oxidoreductase [Kiritimatiellae bacterium]|nr:Gfo/Idh/MocA family oxidoreductase [Kiritimatiellia bacterium]